MMPDPSPIENIELGELIPKPESNPLVPIEFRRHMGQISRQSSVYFSGAIFTTAAGYLFKVYLARVLGAEALGIYALGMTIVGFLSVLNVWGLPQSAVRFVAAYSATGKMDLLRGFIARGTLLLIASNLLMAGVVLWFGRWIAVHFYHTPALRAYLGLFAVLMLIGALTSFLGQVLVGYKDVARRTVITDFIGTPVMMVATLSLVALGLGLWGYIFAQVIGAVVVLVLLLGMVWKLTPKAARSFSAGFPRLEKEVISFSAVVFGVNFLGFLTSQADRVLIGFYLDAREVGIYALAAALVAFVSTILQSVNQIFSPTIADLHARGEHELLGRIFQTLTKWILGLTVPLAILIIVFARPLMQIFGRDFEAGWPILVIGTLGQLVNCGVGSVGFLLLMSGNQMRLIRIQAYVAVLMVVLNLLLIPGWGITGAAVAAAITTVVTNVWCLKDVYSALGLFPYTRSYFRLVPPIAGALLILLLLRARFLNVIHLQWVVMGAGLVLAYLAFVGIALAVGLDSDDRLIAQAAWKRIRAVFQRAEVNA